MSKIGVFYGSTDGHTAEIAAQIQAKLDAVLGNPDTTEVELFDLADQYLEDAADFAYLIFGVPTWNIGQLQRDWETALEELDALDLTDKLVALFGLGDQLAYPDTFVDALFFVADKVQSRGGSLVGRWPADGYSFRSSWACEDGMFLGLVLDEHNQPDQTASRLDAWLALVVAEFGLL